MKYVAKQELQHVGFHVLNEKVTLAGRKAQDNLVKLEKEAHKRLLERKAAEWSDTHEAPFEGNMEDYYPYSGPSEDLVRKERTLAEHLAIKEAVKLLGLKEKASWLLPQITAYIAKMKLPRNDSGKINGIDFLNQNFSKDDWHKGLYRFCTIHQRGLIVPSQSTIQYRNYSALVPLLMMPFKKMDGIKYSEWDKTSINNIVDLSLYAAIYSDGSDLSRVYSYSDILAVRNKGLVYQSGDKEGTSRNPVSAFKLYGLKTDSENDCERELAEQPWLSQVMNTQIWVAHPTIRTNLMILNPDDWDAMPSALIAKDPLIQEEVLYKGTDDGTSTKYLPDLEWLK